MEEPAFDERPLPANQPKWLEMGPAERLLLASVDPTDGKVERRIGTGRGAHVLFVPPIVLDPVTLDPQRSFKIPGGPDDMVFGPDERIWASRRWAQTVAVIDPSTGQMQQIPVGRSPHGIWLNTIPRSPSG